MIRVLISVEGQTEEAFCRSVLHPHLLGFGVHTTTVILTTSRMANGSKFKGGATGWPQIRRDLVGLLGDTSVAGVTTMYDFYGLPADMPTFAPTTPTDPAEQVRAIEAAIVHEIADSRLRPYLQMHEFEALVLAAEGVAAARSGLPGVGPMIRKAVTEAGGPELVNDDPTTAPSKRLMRSWPGYVKSVDGPAIARIEGLVSLRKSCPHFGSWLEWLEGLSEDGAAPRN